MNNSWQLLLKATTGRLIPFAVMVTAALLLNGVSASAQTLVLESWTATADNYTNGADWNPAITGTPTNWPAEFNGVASADYRPDVINGGTIDYVGPSVSDPFDPNWTNTVDQLYLGPPSGAGSTSTDTNTFIMEGGTLTLGIEANGSVDGGVALAVGGSSVNSVSNNAVFTMTGGTLNDISDAAGGNTDASLLVGTGTNATAIVNLNSGTANFNNVYIAGRGIGVVNINGADVNINGDENGISSSGGTPAYSVVVGWGSSGTLSANGKGAGTLNLMSGELDLTNAIELTIGGRCNSATLNVSGGELDTPEIQWGDNVSGKITNTFNFSGGQVNVGSGGVTHLGTETNAFVISGGTVSTLFGQSWSEDSAVNVTLATSPGPGVATFAPAAGTSITLKSAMKGAGSLDVAGPGQVIMGGVCSYTGNTIVSGGEFSLAATGGITASPTVVIAGGATFDLSAHPLTLATGLTVSNSSSPAILNGSFASGGANASLTYAAGTPSFIMSNGVLTISNITVFTINNTGPALAQGSYVIVTNGGGGSVVGTVPPVTVTGGGIVPGTTASLSINNNGLNLVVAVPSPQITSFSVNGPTLTIAATNGPDSGPYTLLQSTNLLLPLSQWTPVFTNAFGINGAFNLSTNVVNPASHTMFYTLQVP